MPKRWKRLYPYIRKNTRPGRRYADDFCVTAEHRETLEEIIIPELKAFLKVRGLELSEEKTRIVNIEGGFDFLGQTMRKFRGNKLITQPSKESLRLHLNKVRLTIHQCGGKNAEFLIRKLNPIIIGWSHYHRFVQSGKAFYLSQYLTNGYLMKWARRNHGNKSPKWLRNHYWGPSKGKRHFSCLIKKGKKSQALTLKYQPDVGLARNIKILLRQLKGSGAILRSTIPVKFKKLIYCLDKGVHYTFRFKNILTCQSY